MFAPVFGVRAYDQQTSFPMPAGLEDAVRFWKLIFTRYSTAQVVLFDPLAPGKIYTVLRAADGEQGQAVIDKERARIAADYDLADDESRIRSQCGSKENIPEAWRTRQNRQSYGQKYDKPECNCRHDRKNQQHRD
jgi:hypothetical protein